MRLDGDVLEFGLPAAFVERAELPLVLDPLLGSSVAWFPGAMNNSPSDAAYLDGSTLIVYKSAPHELRGRMYDSQLGLDATFVLDSLNLGDRVLRPVIGTLENPSLPYFVVAWEVDLNGSTDHDLVYSVIEPGGNGPALSGFLDSGNTNDIHVDLSRGSVECAAVWEEEGGGIRGRVLKVTGFQPTLTVEAERVVSTDTTDRRPAIGSFDNSARLAVWLRDSGTLYQVWGTYWTGATPDNPDSALYSAANPLSEPDCDAGGKDDFFMVWAEAEGPLGTENDIRGRRVFFPGGAGTRVLGPVHDIESEASDDELRPLIRFTGNAYLVAFYDQVGAPDTFWSLETRWLDPMNGTILEGATVRIVNQLSRFGFRARDRQGFNIDTGMLTWPDVQGGTEWIYRQQLESPGGFFNDIPLSGCADGGETRVSTLSDENPGFRIELWNGEPDQPAYLVTAPSRLDLPVGLGLLVPDAQIADVSTVPTTTPDGWAGLDLPLPPGLSGATFYAQWLTLADDVTCTGYRVNLAEALELTID